MLWELSNSARNYAIKNKKLWFGLLNYKLHFNVIIEINVLGYSKCR